jgi:exoribonuclease-2
MPDAALRPDSLVLFKNRPARVLQAGDSLEIELENGRTLKVRPKDVALLHPGPLHDLADLRDEDGEVETAWELLTGGNTTLAELAELAYGAYTPPTAWLAWQLVAEGLYFGGTAVEIVAHTAEEVARKRAARQAKAAAEHAWSDFMERLRTGKLVAEDRRHLNEVEALALGKRTSSRALRELGRTQSPERAHALLCELGHWDAAVNPYPQRLEVDTRVPHAALSDLPEETRLDLTHLDAFAIDDEGSKDPDDALSWHDNRLWVHVADVAALVPPDSDVDLEARARGCNLYLPEGTVPMLPPAATCALGLGLQEVSPALSFGLEVNTDGGIVKTEIVPSWVRVTRLTYGEVETRLEESPFRELRRLAEVSQARRRAQGAVFIELPELKVQVENGRVSLQPLAPLQSRDLVAEAMLLAGEAAAQFALARNLPLPFTTQAAPEAPQAVEGLAGMFALRRRLKRSVQTSEPAPHAGLGLSAYARVTSPLRRYLDLVVHQQLRAYLRGGLLLDSQQILGRVGAAESVTYNRLQAERLTRRHWTLVYLLAHPDWRGDGVVVEKRGPRTIVLIPALGLEPTLALRHNPDLNTVLPLALTGVSLPDLEAYFQVA